eukprot:m.220475 g.220475  ORF g.220475 m.220475 type:complete len:58 (+) comp15116_c1_seq64:4805-4978(+)
MQSCMHLTQALKTRWITTTPKINDRRNYSKGEQHSFFLGHTECGLNSSNVIGVNVRA